MESRKSIDALAADLAAMANDERPDTVVLSPALSPAVFNVMSLASHHAHPGVNRAAKRAVWRAYRDRALHRNALTTR